MKSWTYAMLADQTPQETHARLPPGRRNMGQYETLGGSTNSQHMARTERGIRISEVRVLTYKCKELHTPVDPCGYLLN